MTEYNTLTLNMTGMDEVKKAFQAFPALLQTKIAIVALRQGANYLQKEIKAAAPVSAKGSRELNVIRKNYTTLPSGRLKRAIRVHKSKLKTINKTGSIGMYISIYPGKKRNDPKGAWYGEFVEIGHKIDSRSISLKKALAMGLVAQEFVDAKKRASARDLRQGKIKATGRVQLRIKYKRTRTERVQGRYFIKKTFDAKAQKAAQIIANAAEIAMVEALRNLGLAVTER